MGHFRVAFEYFLNFCKISLKNKTPANLLPQCDLPKVLINLKNYSYKGFSNLQRCKRAKRPKSLELLCDSFYFEADASNEQFFESKRQKNRFMKIL